MFLVRPRPGAPPDAVAAIARRADDLGGLILLHTDRYLIIALPDGGKERLEADPAVGLVGGVFLDEEAEAARPLKRLLITNAARQLVSQAGRAAPGEEAEEQRLTRSPVP
jgi:hypothetical protein